MSHFFSLSLILIPWLYSKLPPTVTICWPWTVDSLHDTDSTELQHVWEPEHVQRLLQMLSEEHVQGLLQLLSEEELLSHGVDLQWSCKTWLNLNTNPKIIVLHAGLFLLFSFRSHCFSILCVDLRQEWIEFFENAGNVTRMYKLIKLAQMVVWVNFNIVWNLSELIDCALF